MSDDWDFYPCRVDGEPASIFVDLGIASDPPKATHQCMAFVALRMRSPQPNGLSSQDEFETLKRLEDALSESLTSARDAVYVGRNTSRGCRDFYFYVASAEGWSEAVEAALQPFKDYRYEAGTRDDPEWDVYFRFLYPSERDWQRIQNRRVCEVLEREGDELSRPREILHWAYFPDESAAARFVRAAEGLGFVAEWLDGTSSGGERGIVVSRIDVPKSIDEINLRLLEAALDSGGYYDGWECQVQGET